MRACQIDFNGYDSHAFRSQVRGRTSGDTSIISKGFDSTMHSLSSPSMAWSLLLVAGLLEVVWSVSMKASDGFTKHMFTGITLVAAWLSFWLLGLAMKSLPVGSAYAVWTGIGAVGASVLGIVLFKEPATAARIVCIAAIVGGILGLKFLPTAGAGTP